jgi:hypothetical protein
MNQQHRSRGDHAVSQRRAEAASHTILATLCTLEGAKELALADAGGSCTHRLEADGRFTGEPQAGWRFLRRLRLALRRGGSLLVCQQPRRSTCRISGLRLGDDGWEALPPIRLQQAIGRLPPGWSAQFVTFPGSPGE